MAIEKVDSRSLDPDLICSKDGKVLERSERENKRVFIEYEQALFSSLADFLAGWRF